MRSDRSRPIKKGNTTYTRNNAFSFSATAPFTVTAWNPNVNGIVNSIAFNGSDCSHAYIGGKFSSVGGTAVKNLAEIDTTTGAVVPTFAHSASAQVQTLLGAAGTSSSAATSRRSTAADQPYFASLDPTTGKDDKFLQLGISGNYSWAHFQRHARLQPGAQPRGQLRPGDG